MRVKDKISSLFGAQSKFNLRCEDITALVRRNADTFIYLIIGTEEQPALEIETDISIAQLRDIFPDYFGRFNIGDADIVPEEEGEMLVNMKNISACCSSDEFPNSFELFIGPYENWNRLVIKNDNQTAKEIIRTVYTDSSREPAPIVN